MSEPWSWLEFIQYDCPFTSRALASSFRLAKLSILLARLIVLRATNSGGGKDGNKGASFSPQDSKGEIICTFDARD